MWPNNSSERAIPNRKIAVNGRSLTRSQPTGVDQLPAVLAAVAEDRGLDVLRPRSGGRVGSNVWEQVVLPLRSRGHTLVSLANSGPLFARHHVTMLHDLSPWDHPEWFSRPYRVKSELVARAWARWSQRILTPSQFSADRAATILGIDPNRLGVVGNAHRWGEHPPLRRPAAEPYVLTVSTLSTRKNLSALLNAWPIVQQSHPELRLKVAGARGAAMLSGSTDERAVSGVDFLGYVDDPILDSLLLGAHAVVSASIYEGFNIPLLDALTIGVPIAMSDIPVHRELYGSAGVVFAPTDHGQIAEAIVEAVDTEPDADLRRSFGSRFAEPAVVQRILDAAASPA